MTTSWPRADISTSVDPPNHAHTSPVRGGDAPSPVPQNWIVQRGVPKLIDLCGLFQMVLGIPPFSNPPSPIISAGEQDGDGDGEPVAVVVAVAVAVSVGVAEA